MRSAKATRSGVMVGVMLGLMGMLMGLETNAAPVGANGSEGSGGTVVLTMAAVAAEAASQECDSGQVRASAGEACSEQGMPLQDRVVIVLGLILLVQVLGFIIRRPRSRPRH